MDNSVLETVLSAVVPAVLILLAWCVKLLTTFVKAKTIELQNKTENETLKTYLGVVSDNAINVVQSLNQTVVDGLRNASEDGKLTASDAADIKEKAVNMLVGTLSDDIKNLLDMAFGDTRAYLETVIERTVCDVKKSNSPKG